MDKTGTLTLALNASSNGTQTFMEGLEKTEVIDNLPKTKPIYERYEDILRQREENVRLLREKDHLRKMKENPDNYVSNHMPKMCERSREIALQLGRSRTPVELSQS